MHFKDYFVILFVSVCFLIFLIVLIYKKIKFYLLARRATNISKATVGPVVLKGKVGRFDQEILAPLSRKHCLGYLYLIVDKKSRYERIIHSEIKGIPFILNDGTGRCLINSEAAGDFYNTKLWPPTIRFSQYSGLNEAISKEGNISAGKRYRHMEYRRQEGETIYVEGLYQTTSADLNLEVLGLNGMVESSKDLVLKISPAYCGSSFESRLSKRDHWITRFLDCCLEIFST